MKVACLVSGGVDSSVALALLKEQGHDVTAFYLKIWLEEDVAFLGECPWEEDLRYVRQTCEQLNIPLRVVNLQREYWNHVVSYALDEVKAGRTPNPDMFCNALVKFGVFLEKIDADFDRVATGHYAQLEDGRLECAPDPVKDQTYFLARLSDSQLKRAMFPIGHLTKAEVRKLAQDFNLPAKDRKDSQGICFLGKIKYSEFVEHYLGRCKGDFVDADTGKKVGEHEGYWFYTIGQRKGIPLGDGPWYVVGKDVKRNAVLISKQYDEHPRNECFVQDIHWIAEPELHNVRVKVRHGPESYPAKVKKHDDGYLVTLDSQDQGLAPGQFVVFYHQNVCLGSGVITARTRPC